MHSTAKPEVKDFVHSNGAIRVLLADRHPVVGEALGRRIDQEADVEVLGWFTGSAAAARRIGERPSPDVVLADVNLPDASPLATARRMRNQLPGVRVVFMTDRYRPGQLHLIRRAHADGLVLKSEPLDRLREALHTVVSGGTAFQGGAVDFGPSIHGEMVGAAGSTPVAAACTAGQADAALPADTVLDERLEQLTDREFEVLTCIARGFSRAAIADQLEVADATAATHARNLMQKLRMHDRVDLTRLALGAGLAPL